MSKTVEDVIRERGFFVTKPKGTSMYPMLRLNCDHICVVRPELPLKRYDVAMFRRSEGVYVLHRVMDVTESGYTFCGDNQCFFDRGITDDMIVGVLDSWFTGEKKHTVRDKGYLRYVRFWCSSMTLRRYILWFCHRFLWRKYRGKSVG